MPNNLTGSGGIDTSGLDKLISEAYELLDVEKQINNTKVKPVGDDSDIQKVKKTINDIKNEVNNTNRTNVELWNTKEVQKNVGKTKEQFDELIKTFNSKKINPQVFSSAEKQIINAYAKLRVYSEKFGQQVSSDYENSFRDIFSNIFNSADTFKKEDIKGYLQDVIKQNKESLNENMSFINAQANETATRNQIEIMREEAAEARANAEAYKEAQREKKEALLSNRDEMVNALQAEFNSLKNVGSQDIDIKISDEEAKTKIKEISDLVSTLMNGNYDVSYEQFSGLQDSFYGVSQTLTALGYNVEYIEDLFAQWQNTVYIPKDQFNAIKSAMSDTTSETKELVDETNELSTIKTFDSANISDYANILLEIAKHLSDIKTVLGTIDENNGFNSIISSVDILLEKLDEMYSKIGTGVNNITINKGDNVGSANEALVSGERDRLLRSYNKIIKSFGGEESAFSSMSNILPSSFGENKAEEYNKLFSSTSIGSITNMTEQINRLRLFFGQIDQYKKELEKQLSAQLSYIKELEQKVKQNPDDESLSNTLKSEKAQYEVGKTNLSNVSKYRLPSRENTNLNKKINELNEQELNLEDDKVDLTEITEKLEAIRSLLSDISQKNLFGDSLDIVNEKLDEIVSKFENIVSKVQVINETPIATEGQTDVTLAEDTTVKGELSVTAENNIKEYEREAEATKELTDAIKEKNNAERENVTPTTNTDEINKETQANLDLVNAMDKVDQERADNNIDQVTVSSSTNIEKTVNSIKAESDATDEINAKKENLINTNNEIVESAISTSSATEKASEAIKDEGKAAEEASKKKEDFANANKEVAKSSEDTVSSTEKASEAIKDEGKAAEETSKKAQEQAEKIASAQRILASNIEQQKAKIEGTKIKTTDGFEYSEDLQNRISDTSKRIDELKTKLNSITTAQGLKEWRAEFAAVGAEVRNVNNSIREEEAVYRDVQKAIKDTDREQKQASDRASKDLSNQTKILAEFKSWVAKNGAAYKSFGDEIEAVYSKLGSNSRLTSEELREVTNEINRIKTQAADAGKLGGTFFNTLKTRAKSLVAYLSTFASFYRVASYVRSAITTIIDLDTQLVDLRKTTSMTTSELNQFYNSASNVSKELGVTTSEIISQASAWSRLGYSTKEASTEMAKLSSQFASISPGMDTDSATDTLVSTMQAYKIGVDDVQRTVMDNINAIGNSMATTNEEIGEMLQRSSAAMKAANNSLEETIALESAAVEITRNAETTGTAFRTISMRIRGKQSLPPYSENYMLCA